MFRYDSSGSGPVPVQRASTSHSIASTKTNSQTAGSGKGVGSTRRASYMETAKHMNSRNLSKSFKMMKAATTEFKRDPFSTLKRSLKIMREKIRSARVLNLAIRDYWFMMDFTLVLAGGCMPLVCIKRN